MCRRTMTILAMLVLTVPAFSAIHLPRNRATILPVGPFVDFADGVTPEIAMTATNITCSLARRSDAGGVGANPTLVINTTLTATGGSNDLVLLAGSTTGLYGLELTAVQLATVGEYKLSLSDPDVMCPWFCDIIVDPNTVYDSLYAGAAAGTDTLPVDVTQWLGTAVTALSSSADVNGLIVSGSKVAGKALGYTAALATNIGTTNTSAATLLTRLPQTLTFTSVGGTQMPQVTMAAILGTAIPAESQAGRDAAGFGKFFDVATPVSTVAAGGVSADLVYAHGSAITEAGGAGRLAAAISTWGNVATPVATAANVNLPVDANGLLKVAVHDVSGDSNMATTSDMTTACETALDNVGVDATLTAKLNALSGTQTTLHSGIAQTATARTITLAADANDTDNYYKNERIVLVSGTGSGQSNWITRSNGTTKIARVKKKWATTPDSTTTYEIQPADSEPRKSGRFGN